MLGKTLVTHCGAVFATDRLCLSKRYGARKSAKIAHKISTMTMMRPSTAILLLSRRFTDVCQRLSPLARSPRRMMSCVDLLVTVAIVKVLLIVADTRIEHRVGNI